MPTIIKGLGKVIPAEAKKLLLEQGIRDLNLRELAQRCGIAVGTIYNYYSSKDILIAEVIMEDWNDAAEKAQKEIKKAKSGADGVAAIYDAVQSFFCTYKKVFGSFQKKPGVAEEYRERILDGITELLKYSFEFFPCAMQPVPYKFFAENIFYAGTQGRMSFDEIRPVLERIL